MYKSEKKSLRAFLKISHVEKTLRALRLPNDEERPRLEKL